MSKDKRGRKCKGRHCAWCKPVKNYLTVAEAHAMLLAQNIYWQRGEEVMGFTIPLRGGGFIELPPDITTHEQLAEWGHLWATFGEAERRRARNRPMTRRASRRYPR